MKSFKSFIIESEEKYGKVSILSFDDAVDLAKQKCELNGAKIWRGSNGLPDYALIDTLPMKRPSKDSYGWSNFLIDTAPSFKDFPKRSKSIICSTRSSSAQAYSNNLYFVLPFNGSKIAWSKNYSDFIETHMNFLNKEFSIDSIDFNLGILAGQYCKDKNRRPSDKNFTELCNLICEKDEVFNQFNTYFKGVLGKGDAINGEKLKNKFIDYFTPSNLSVDTATSAKDVPDFSSPREIWIEGESILVHSSFQSRFEEAIK